MDKSNCRASYAKSNSAILSVNSLINIKNALGYISSTITASGPLFSIDDATTRGQKAQGLRHYYLEEEWTELPQYDSRCWKRDIPQAFIWFRLLWVELMPHIWLVSAGGFPRAKTGAVIWAFMLWDVSLWRDTCSESVSLWSSSWVFMGIWPRTTEKTRPSPPLRHSTQHFLWGGNGLWSTTRAAQY